MTDLPYNIRRRQRRFVVTIALLAFLLFCFSLELLWIAAGMMIESSKVCWIMQPCLDSQLAQYRYPKAIATGDEQKLAKTK